MFDLNSIALQALLGLSSLLGVTAVPEAANSGWRLVQDWTPNGSASDLVTESTAVVEACRASPSSYVEFPVVVHGAHTIWLDGAKIAAVGDSTFREAGSFYVTPVLKCDAIAAGQVLRWQVSSYATYFARFNFFPRVESERPLINVFQETLNIIASGALLLLSVVAFLLFWGKVPNRLALSIALGNFFSAGYFMGAVAPSFGWHLDMLTTHKIADSCLWIFSCLLLHSFHCQGLFGRAALYAHFACSALALTLILGGSTGDVIQFGTMIPFGTFFGIAMVCVGRLALKTISEKNERRRILEILSLGSFVLTALSDFLTVSGLRDGGVLLSVGVVAGLIFLTLGVNEYIVDTYVECDYLRKNLEREVSLKTHEIQAQATELESTLQTLRTTQSELVHAAKLASLGTLSAGIAHEINNSLNYVNGALVPLATILERTPDFDGKAKAAKLIGVMNNGLELTFGIISSLRSYTGLNQAKIKDCPVADLVTSVLTIIKSKIPPGVQVATDIEQGLSVYVNAAAINQVLMNLIVNAIDAMPQGGTLTINAHGGKGRVQIAVTDTGVGIPEGVLVRIFDPFFTTKDVGKGTGLGLHICKNEVERHGGSLKATSVVGVGTTFIIDLPKEGISAREDAA